MALDDTVDNIRAARRMTATEVSLDAPVERQRPRGAAPSASGWPAPATGEIEEHDRRPAAARVHRPAVPAAPDPARAKILSLYYGLEEGSEALTLEKIGALLGVTRERIRQIRERAFEKLRDSPDVKSLRGFWVRSVMAAEQRDARQ